MMQIEIKANRHLHDFNQLTMRIKNKIFKPKMWIGFSYNFSFSFVVVKFLLLFCCLFFLFCVFFVVLYRL